MYVLLYIPVCVIDIIYYLTQLIRVTRFHADENGEEALRILRWHPRDSSQVGGHHTE